MSTTNKTIASYWFNRFQVIDQGNGNWLFRDWLQPSGHQLPAINFIQNDQRERDIAFFQQVFLRGALSSAVEPVQNRKDSEGGSLFWQFPCRTEAAAWENHAQLEQAGFHDNEMHIYLGLPWATWIDFERQKTWQAKGQQQKEQQLRFTKVRLTGIRHALHDLGVKLRVHTVCQHIQWRDLLPTWQRLGITDLWVSHCPQDTTSISPMTLHPWALFAVNVEDPQRSIGIEIGKDPGHKQVLASFVGAYMPHYLSDIRLRLQQFADEAGFIIRVTDKWHFNDVVYQHQMRQRTLDQTYHISHAISDYNQLLSSSVFSLCPAGAGPNSLRLWESLAVGAIPVLLGDRCRLPEGGNLPPVDWDSILLRIADAELANLPSILRNMPMDEIRKRQQAGMQAYQLIRSQRCF